MKQPEKEASHFILLIREKKKKIILKLKEDH